MQALAAFRSLRNPVFARLYAAQTISLLGDAITWVGLALLAVDLAGERAAAILGTALTLRVIAYVLLSPLAGVLADRVSRKTVMVTADLARVAIVGAIALVTAVWQVYLLILLLNAFTAFFTPTFQATIPLVTKRDTYPKAIALSGATYELLGVLGPGLAGALAALLGTRSLFWLDAGTFLASAILVLSVRANLRAMPTDAPDDSGQALGRDVRLGTTRLWRDPRLRYALVLELVASIAGAWILVNTVVRVEEGLALGQAAYGWIMAAFGVGATLAALAVGAVGERLPRTTLIALGALVTSLAILPASVTPVLPLALLWFAAGAGQNWVNLPTQTLIADRTPQHLQGRVYGAHFAWSHLWWVGAYPLAGWLGTIRPGSSFVYGGLVALALLVAAHLLLAPPARDASAPEP